MPHHSFNVSVTAPLTPAIERVKTLLFRPFDLNTWLVLGFCAWLDQLGHFRGGGGTGFRFGNHPGESLRLVLERAKQYLLNNYYWLIPVGLIVGVVALIIWLLVTWLSSRGQFMFLDNVVTGRKEIVTAWAKLARPADSLFVFRTVLGLVAMTVLLPMVGLSFWFISQLGEGGTPLPFIGLIGIALTGFGFGLLALIVQKLTRDFVVPIMYLQNSSCIESWRRFSILLADHALNFLLYLLFSIVIAIGIGILVFAAVIATCCCAGCLLAIPFVGTLLLLPIYIFTRAYSLEYLAQYGPGFNVFTPLAPGEPAPLPS